MNNTKTITTGVRPVDYSNTASSSTHPQTPRMKIIAEREAIKIVSDLMRVQNGMMALFLIKHGDPEALLRSDVRISLDARVEPTRYTGWHYLAAQGPKELGAIAVRIILEDKRISGLAATDGVTVASLLRR
jgi:hypothetical protein